MDSRPLTRQIEEAVEILKDGGVVAFPTDTLYGLGAAISSVKAVEKVYAIKRRPLDQPLPVLLARVDQLQEVALDLSSMALCLAGRFWPGALTIVVKRSERVPDIVTAGGGTVAVRVPDHPVAQALIRGAGPITGTSANLSGLPPATTAAEVRRQLGDTVDYIIEAGPAPRGIESTIVDATGRVPVIVREGAVTSKDIERACLQEASRKRRLTK